MYNGIGLQTVRGSATSGHVQKNMSHIRPEFFRSKIEANMNRNRDAAIASGGRMKSNPEIMEHMRKREVEAKVYAMRDQLESSGHTELEIEQQLAEYRTHLELNSSSSALVSRGKDSHSIALRKDSENEKVKQAFGIVGDFNEGDSFNKEVQDQRRLSRLKERDEKELAWKKRKEEEEAMREASRLRREQAEKARTEERLRMAESPRARSRSRDRYGARNRHRDTAKDSSDRWALQDGYDRRSKRPRRDSRSMSRDRSRSPPSRRDRSRSPPSRRDRSRSPVDRRRKDRRRSRCSESRSPSSRRSNSRSSAPQNRADVRRTAADTVIDDCAVSNPSLRGDSRDHTDAVIGQQSKPGARKSRFSSAVPEPTVVDRTPASKSSEQIRDRSRSHSSSSSNSSSRTSRSRTSSSSSSSSSSARSEQDRKRRR